MYRKTLSALLILLLALSLATGCENTVFAAEPDSSPRDLTSCTQWPQAPEIDSECAILMEAKTGAVLYAKNMDETCYPASITKIMTALVVLENCSLDETVTFSYRATHELEEGSTSIARTEGEEMSVEDCLYALLLVSANEVAQGLAEHVGGTIEDFVVLMNEKAEELGCTNTHFSNPSGLNDESNYTTCRDMAVIMQAAVQNPYFLAIDSTLSYTIPATNKHDEELPIANKHQLVQNTGNHYDGAIAGKTGYTTIALNTLVTYAQRGDMDLICVVMKSRSSHYPDTVSLLDYGFDNFTMYRLSDTDTSSLLSDAPGELAGAVIPENEWLVLPNSMAFDDLDRSLDLTEETGDDGSVIAGRIRYSYEGLDFGTALLTLPSPAETEAFTEEDLTTAAIVPETEEETETEAEEQTLPGMILSLPDRMFRSLESLIARLEGPYRLLLLIPIFVIALLIILLCRSSSRDRRRKSSSYSGIPYGYIASGKKHGRRRRRKRYR